MSRDCTHNNNNVGGIGNTGRDTVCVHTDKVYDACKDKDCVVDARVYLTRCGQEIVDRAINVKFRKAEIIWVYTDVELSIPVVLYTCIYIKIEVNYRSSPLIC